MAYYIYKLFSIITWFITTILLIIMLILIFGFFSPGIDDVNMIPMIHSINSIDHSIMQTTRDYLPTKYEHKDISRYVALGSVLFIFWFFSYLHGEFAFRANYYIVKRQTAVLTKKMQRAQLPAADAKALQEINTQLENPWTSRQYRRKLLKDFVKIKKQLEDLGKNLAFLSIDVVDSTGMKEDDDSYTINNDFLEYHQFVESRINANRCIKAAWTPDGLMACFSTIDDAIRAAQIILNDLPEFNKRVKNIKHDFILRCGINAGYLFFDDSQPLEQISDRIIDIAGHMQKKAQPNTIYIAKQVIKPVEIMKGFIETESNIDGLTAYQWQPPLPPQAGEV